MEIAKACGCIPPIIEKKMECPMFVWGENNQCIIGQNEETNQCIIKEINQCNSNKKSQNEEINECMRRKLTRYNEKNSCNIEDVSLPEGGTSSLTNLSCKLSNEDILLLSTNEIAYPKVFRDSSDIFISEESFLNYQKLDPLASLAPPSVSNI
jgi:hypothetical protein